MVDILRIIELTFSAAHYLPHHPKCGCIHGHTYFVRNLLVDCEKFVDIGDIKAVIGLFDHMFIVPKSDLQKWIDIDLTPMGIKMNFQPVDGAPIVENIHKAIKEKLMTIPNVLRVRFELYEGPNQGVTYVSA